MHDLDRDARERRRDRAIAWFGILGVVYYVGTWFVLGIVREGYVPTQQAISELFDLGAPLYGRVALSLALVITGGALVVFGGLLDKRLPGDSSLGPKLLAFSGAMTVAVVPFPCTAGCPGMGESFTDTMHVVTAGSGYIALVTAPIATGWRIREHLPRLAAASMVLGSIALVGFIVRNAGVDQFGGLQQRIFNTTADAWIALMGWHLLRRMDEDDAAGRTTGAGDRSVARDR